jgi:hypothetical protein
MSADKALANLSILPGIDGGGDTGRGRVERISFFEVRFTHRNYKKWVFPIHF